MEAALLAERRRNAVRDRTIDDGMRERCERIRADADEGAGTLDHYTTLRVKMAFQRMNLQALAERTASVDDRIRDLEDRLRGIHPAPTAEEAQVLGVCLDEAGQDDPNQLCVPLAEDFALPPP